MDDLETAWRRVARQISDLQAELDRLHQKFEVLDKARAILLQEGRSASSQTDSSGSRSLQADVLGLVNAGPDDGVRPRDVADQLIRLNFPGSESPNFYASVYTTLSRLAAKDEIRKFNSQGGGWRFARRPTTQSLPLGEEVTE